MARLETLGEFLKEQRHGARLTLRQLADQAGVSNPYLSQIERGLRRPSAEVLQQLAHALRISARTLYVHAGILDVEEHESGSVELAILTDPELTDRQRHVLLDIYASFRRENDAPRAAADLAPAHVPPADAPPADLPPVKSKKGSA